MATAPTHSHSSHQVPGYYDIALRDSGLSLARLAVASEAMAGSPARMREARV